MSTLVAVHHPRGVEYSWRCYQCGAVGRRVTQDLHKAMHWQADHDDRCKGAAARNAARE